MELPGDSDTAGLARCRVIRRFFLAGEDRLWPFGNITLQWPGNGPIRQENRAGFLAILLD